jgi:2-dehydro-3-deoxyphosphogluconate aldolase / (4S)-4-hydroxy-2-oxoglutarate aldolase
VTHAANGTRGGPVADAIRAARLIAVLRRVEPRERLLELVEQLVEDGVRVLEITMDAPSAGDDLAAVRDRLGGRDVIVGAGTVLRRGQLEDALAAGADFGVSPLLDAGMLEAALAAGLPFVPGAMSPTEVIMAWAGGATFVKLFPASAVGPAFVRELRGPLPDVQLVPTGGIDAANAAAFLEAGASAVGVGSGLTGADREARRAIVRAVAAAGTA